MADRLGRTPASHALSLVHVVQCLFTTLLLVLTDNRHLTTTSAPSLTSTTAALRPVCPFLYSRHFRLPTHLVPAAMAPSPRKRAAAAAFNQTWDDSDAAFLDTGSLPLGKIPRGWERKQDKKKLAEGKERSIWRRFNFLSRNTAPADEDESEEESDTLSRAVKRQQRMSPKAMEKSNGSKRSFKATRWDRTKGALPSRRSCHPWQQMHR
jgi:hypothetical protein